MEPTTEGAKPTTAEITTLLERPKSREEVIGALNGGLALLDKEIQKSATPPPELDWIQKSVKDAKDKSARSRIGTSLNIFYDPQAAREIQIREGIPVDHLISFIEKKAAEYPPDTDEAKELITWAQTLKESSLPLYEARHKLTRKGEDTFRNDQHDLIRDARIRQEANLMAGDPKRDKGNMLSNYYAAEKLLEQRRELVIPASQKKDVVQSAQIQETEESVIPDYDKSHLEDTAIKAAEDAEKSRLEILENANESQRIEEEVEESAKERERINKEVAEKGQRQQAMQDEMEQATVAATQRQQETEEAVNTPATTGPATATAAPETGQPAPIIEEITRVEQPQVREYHGRLISTQDLEDIKTHLEATKSVNADQRAGRVWEFWRWPKKIGLRLTEGGIINTRSERLTRAKIANNISFLTYADVRNGTTNIDEKRARSEREKQAVLERFKQGQVLKEGREQQVEVQGGLRDDVIRELIRPIDEGGITDANQLRATINTFVRAHLNDPRPDVRQQIESIFGTGANDFGRVAESFATDLLDMGIKVRQDRQQLGESWEQISQYIHIHIGLARETQNTDIRTATDRAVAWARRRQNESLARGARGLGFSGVILNPAVVGVATSLGTQGILRGLGWGARVAAVPSFMVGGVSGAAIAGGRRYIELGRDRRMDLAERERGERTEQRQHSRTALGRIFERVAGGYRREDLERYVYDSATFEQLHHGGGRELVGGGTRDSIATLLSQDLGIRTNQEAAARRLAEIYIRVNRGQQERVAWITQLDQEKLTQLLNDEQQIRQALQAAGANLTQLERDARTAWNDELDRDHRQKDDGFRGYRRRNTLGAAFFGGTVGLGAGLGFQEAVAVTHRVLGDTGVGRTVLENIFDRKAPNEWFGGGGTGASVDKLKELYKNPGHVEISKGITLDVGADRAASFYNNTGQKIVTPPMHVNGAGQLIISGKPDNLPTNIKNAISGWANKVNTDPKYNLQEHLKTAASGTGHETFQHGDWIVDVNSDPNTHQFSMQRWLAPNPDGTFDTNSPRIQIHGFINPDGTTAIDHSFGANTQLTDTDWSDVESMLRQDGWNITKETIPGTGNALDALFNQPPDVLKAQGIVETDQFQKTWHFHVLRPDIVDATGNHTHNELTLHLGGDYQVATKQGDQIIPGAFRHGVGNPGELNTGSELHGGAIQSHLSGVPPQEDPVLNELIRKAGGLKMSDTVFVVDLTNGKQIMLPTDLLGNGKLPDGLYDPQTGSPRGIETIATAVLQKPDGSIINPTELFTTGKIPDGSVVHSLASERFLPGELPPTPPKEIFTFEPPIATEFTPPTVETPPIPVIPWAPRHPLEPLRPTPGLPPIPPPTYYSGVELQEAQRWIQENPRTHRPRRRIRSADGQETWVEQDGRPVVRDIRRERDQIEEFIRNIESTDPNHYTQLKDFESKLPSMNEQTRAVVLIPAWMEGKNLYRLLKMYTRQVDKNGHELNPNLYEINILVNRKTGEQADESVAEIERFKANAEAKGRHFQINYLNVEFEPPFNNVGNARRVLTNLTLMRSLRRPNQAGPLYIESEDADLTHVDQRTVTNLIEKLDEKPYLDAVRGIQDRDPEIMMNNDFLFLYRRIQDFKEILLRQHAFRIGRNPQANFNWNRIITGGWNTGFTAEAYALIGGYNPYMPKGEDMLMGELMSMARGNGNMPNTEVIGTVPTRSDSSPRRYILEVASGRAAYGPDFEDPQVNAEIRNKTVNELIERISPLARLESQNLPTFQAMLNNEYQFIKNMVPSEQTAQNTANIIMFYLGFKQGDFEYTPNGQLSIKNIANVQDALSNYRARHQTPRKPGERMRHKTPERAPSRSQGLIAQVNNTLVGTTTAQTTFEAPTQETVEFLRKIDLPLGQTDTKTEISGNQINIVGSIGTVRGTARFEANLTIDENGQLKVSDHKVTNIPIGLRGQKEIIERQVSNLDRAIVNQINWQIDQAWEVSGFHITDGKLVLDFKKKAAPTQAATPEQPPTEAASATTPTADQVPEQVRREGEQAVQQARERAQQIGQQAREQLRQDYENRIRGIIEDYARDNNISFDEARNQLKL